MMRKSMAILVALLVIALSLPTTCLCELARDDALGIAVELPTGWHAPKKQMEGYFIACGRNVQNTLVICRRPEKPKIWDQDGLMERLGQVPGFEFISYHASKEGAERPWMSFKNISKSEEGTKTWSFFYYYTLTDGATASCGISLIKQPDAAMLAWIAAVEENLLGEALIEE